MFRITPIGSCRIATPLRLARDGFGFLLNQTRVYGYSHSSAEAVQMMRYLHGGFEVDPIIAPLISRRGLGEEDAGPHRPSDLYVVEISSAKAVRIGDACIQLNYLSAHFNAFFSSRDRASAYWEVVEAGNQDQIDGFLADHWSADDQQRSDSAILRQIRRTLTTDDDLRRDIRALLDGLPAVLFVTHVDACTPDGHPIPSRSRFIRSVEAAVRAEGGVVYNPTRAMQAMGQTFAIEDYSDSLAHFTEDFSRVVFQDWFDLTIAAAMDRQAETASPEGIRQGLAVHVAARLAAGETTQISRRLERLVRCHPGNGGLRDLLASTYAALGQAGLALETLRGISAPPLAEDRADLTRRRFDLALGIGDAHELEGCIADLEGLEHLPPAPDLLTAAEVIRGAGNARLALHLMGMALQADTGLLRAADGVFAIVQQDPGLLTTLPASTRDRAAALLDPARRVHLLHLAGDRDAILALVRSPGQIDAGDLADHAIRLTADGQRADAAALLTDWRKANQRDRIAHPGLCRLVDHWLQEAAATPDRNERLARLAEVLRVQPLHSEGRVLMRALRREILADLRSFSDRGDLAALEGLKPQIDRLEDPVPEYDLFRMRLLFQRADHAAAIIAARQVLANAPDNLTAWVTIMRAAQKTGDLLTLEEASQAIIARADDDCRRLADEAQDRLDRNPALCLRAARDEADPLRAHRLLSIARRNPALQTAAENRLRRVEAQLTTALRHPDATDDDTFAAFADAAGTLLPDNDRVRLSLGRLHLRRRDFAAALEHWDYLATKVPDNESYSVQADRCRKMLGVTAGGGDGNGNI